MNKKQTTIITALSLLVLVLTLMVSSRLWFRLDLTRNKAYTISPASRELSREIPGELRITYYLSDELKTAYAIPGEIEDILREYAARSRGKIRVSVKDPVKSGMQASVEELGVAGRQMQVVERNQATVALVYSGILIEYLDKSSVIPWVGGSETIEYDLTSRIRSLVNESERHVGIVVGDNGKLFDNDYGYVSSALQGAGYRVSVVYPDYEVPDMLPALFVFGGGNDLTENALYRIDRYVQRGGKVLFATDALASDEQLSVRPVEGGLLAMLKTYGVAVETQFALDTSSNIVQAETPGAPGRIQLIRYPFWVSVLGEYGNRLQPITSTFAGLDLYWPSPLTLDAPPGVEAEALFTTTEDAWLQTENFNIMPAQSWAWVTERDATAGVKTLGAALTGTFPRYFPTKPQPVDNEGGQEDAQAEVAPDSLPDMPVTAKEARIIVVGDAEMGLSRFLEQTRSQRNLDFLVAAADWLSNDDDIIGIRSRASGGGRLDRIIDEEKRAAAMGFSHILGVVVMPLAVVVLGLTVAGRRKKIAGRVSEQAEG
ncbi:MAG: GldG family protein [Spirochaetaceae bacterium]|jgi:ABC-type uncharacterized transport system involved in gliding motility auxiliary subunit|nr:GldG family protein [Spirochaetaceae bacterium]